MELLQDSAVKNTYNKCKYKVKYWEHHFKKKHGRLPSKLDIREADRETRQAYKTYFNLKSAALEQSFQDIDGFNSDEESAEVSSADLSTLSQVSVNESIAMPIDISENSSVDVEDVKNTNTDNTWGDHLNNVNIVAKAEEKKEKMKVNSSITQKLFKNSVFSKRNPRKSLSFSHRKSDNSLNASNKTLSQPMPQLHESGNDNAVDSFESDQVINILNSDRIKITTVVEPVMTRNLSAVKSVLNENFRSERQIDPGWMKRLAQSTGTKLTNKSMNVNNFGLSQHLNSKNDDGSDYDSEDIIADSDDDDNAQLHIAKRRKIDENTSVPVSRPPVIEPKAVVPQIKPVVQEIKQIAAPVIVDANKCDIDVMDVDEPEEEVYKQQKPVLKLPETQRKSVRQRKVLNEIKEVDDSPFQNDEDKDPEYIPKVDKDVIYNFDEEDEEEETSGKVKKTKETKVKKEKSPKVKKERAARGKAKKVEEKAAEEAEQEEENDTYELEYSIKPRIVTVPRDTNLKNIIKKSAKAKPKKEIVELKDEETGAIVKDKNQQKIEKFQKRIESGTLNDNYVQINMKKKVYARGKKTMNFSKYKKKMWKQHKKNTTLAGPDMDMGGCDGGQLTCFTCGQVGHFAQNCKATKGDALLPMSAAEIEYCPYPTLEEASEMAQDSSLAVRRPLRKVDGEGEADNEEDSSDDDDDSEEDDDDDEEKEDVFGDDGEDELLLCETMKLEEYVKKIDVQQYVDESRIIKPYYNLKNDGTIIDTPQEVFDVLKMFGHSSFRPGQEKAVMRILSGQSTLVTLSTGSGKSFCYQLPAYLYAKREPCISLIISPLVSLMEDQVTGIPAFLRAACLHTNKTKIQREKILEAIKTGSLDVLLVSPEAVVAGEKSNGFGSLLRKLPPVAFACIDEAHCVSQWSHNFRPSYLMICRILKERLGITTILGLTATATRATSDSIISHLSIPDGRLGIISDIPLPNNLRLTVSKDGNRDHALLGLLLSERFAKLRSVIVYCTRRQECERIAAFLRTSLKEEKPIEENTKKRKKVNLQAEPYHAGLAASRRRTVQNRFMSGDLRIVVATVAFGMGINKSDIRAVIHYNLPKNFESYVQEVGRAGRDGLPAHCHLFLDSLGKDENELQRHVFSDSIDRHVIRKLLQKIFIPCSCKAACPKHEVAFSVNDTVLALDLPEENISTLLCYLELHEDRYIEVLSSAYTTCKVISYGGGGNYMRKAAKDCPPLAMALAMFGDKDRENESTFEFPIVDVAAAMGWDSGICKHKLKNLEWVTVNNQPRRSLLTVRFTNLGFRLLAPGNLTDTQLDEALDALYQRVCNQERTALLQLHALHETVTMVAAPSYRACIAEEISEKESKLKPCIRDYFDNPKPLSVIELKEKTCNEDLIAADVRAMVSMYRDNTFTGRAIARIFFGIFSPNYPAVIWGRCKYWRAHINADFNAICRIATREILKMR
ncbi:PREDICTED: ATP-dependent DNA helicase Q4 [Nicrophorus vespilloides]|uniref:DNA 3'-5' helicase n=1 Tax=Nicrophorus vespilloides TaxID=110193 RepID=A0ABM1MXA5_NICVS|nr:PREDICTED: ATP-dependent DNA helicase Q4 [Nicrophorus vespilloides]